MALSALVGRSLGIRPWQFNDFTVIPNLWGALITPPGWMKTYAIDEGFRHTKHMAHTAHEAFESNKEDVAAEVAVIEESITDIRRRIRAALKADETTGDLKEQLVKKGRELKDARAIERRYLTHDATVEKLTEILKDNPRGLVVLRDELYGLLASFSRSGRENDRQFYLEGWNGSGSFSTDRIGRGSLYIDAICLSIFGAIQPGRVRRLIDDATGGGAGDDGLLQRFQLTIWPERLDEWKKPTCFPDSAHKAAAFAIYRALDTLSAEKQRATTNDGDIPYLRFSPSAQTIADGWLDSLEGRLRSDDLNATPAYASHLSKYRSLMPSLALLFHLINVADGVSNPGPVTEAPTQLAIYWCAFLEEHARKIYDVEIDRGKAAARLLAAKIKAGAIVDNQPVREIYRNQWAGLRTDETVLAGIGVLADLHWVRTEAQQTRTRSAQVVRLNPAFVQEVI